MFFQDNLLAQLAYLERRLSQTKKLLRTMPAGAMIIKESRGKKYYYIKKQGKLHNLKAQPKLINRYLQKKKLLKDQRRLEANIKSLSRVAADYLPMDEISSFWEHQQANQNPYKIQEKQHLYKGIYYRSKSEAAIAALLTSYNIEFKYEPKLDLNGRYVYPDFLIKHPKSKKIFIWEHFGLVSSDTYLQKTFYKLNNYHLAGYNIWDNLLVSFDNENGSLNIDTIDRIIHLFLL